MVSNLGLILEQTQKLALTPELIQAIKILQFSAAELEQYAEEELLNNPALERIENKEEIQKNNGDEDFDLEKYLHDRQFDDICYHQPLKESDDFTYEEFTPYEGNYTDDLLMQLSAAGLPEEIFQIGSFIIYSLNDNGYLDISVSDITTLTGCTKENVLRALNAVQRLEPAGIAARDLKECLKLQLIAFGRYDNIYKAIIENHLEDLAANRIGAIAKKLNIDTESAQNYCDNIRSLDPKPASGLSKSAENRYIIPDISIEKVSGEYVVLLNDKASPQLTVSSYCRKILNQSESDPKTAEFLTGKVNSALWLVKGIEQRKRTIQKITEAIVERQRDFLERGREFKRPLTLYDIACAAGVHESTVSRTVNGKYVQTPRGIFELKSFFGGGTVSADGKDVAAESIKHFIKDIISSENPKHPLSDECIKDRLLSYKGISIARRTIAKYREELGIMSSSKRKRY